MTKNTRKTSKGYLTFGQSVSQKRELAVDEEKM